jgi:hypothetical protein
MRVARVETDASSRTFGTSLIGYLVEISGYWRIIPMTQTHPIEDLSREIEKALEARLFYLALLLTLTLPDVCAALEQPNGRTSQKIYEGWYKRNVFQRIGGLSPEEAYELRNTVVHQSSALSSEKRKYSRIIFTMPGECVTMDSMVLNDAMTFEVGAFCKRWIGCVRDWIAASRDNANVKANLPSLLQVRPHGLPPYTAGVPIIA